MSAHNMLTGRALRFPGEPVAADQTLIGLVADRVAFHVLGNINGVLRRAGISMDYPGSLSKVDPAMLAKLAPILGCSEAAILARVTPPTNPSALNSPARFGDAIVEPFELETHRRRISPLSLKASPHHREAWLIKLLPYCPVSLELLRSDCSKCGRPLRWKVTRGVDRCDSEECDERIQPTVAPLLEESLAEDYRLFADLFSSLTDRRNAALHELSDEVRLFGPLELIDMIIAVGLCVEAADRQVSRKMVHKLPPDRVARICAGGTAMLRSWPHGIRNWADEKAERLKGDYRGLIRHRKDIRRLGRRFLVSDMQAETVKRAFPDLFANVRRSFAKNDDIILRIEAGRLLGITPNRLDDLVAHSVVSIEKIGDSEKHIRFRRSEIIDLQKRLTGSRSSALINRTNGLPFYAIEQLRVTGALTSETHAGVLFLRGADCITIESVAAMATELEKMRNEADRSGAVEPIGTAARRIGGRLKPWATIFEAIRNGALPFWSEEPITIETNWMRMILVRPEDMKAFDQAALELPGGGVFESGEDCSLTDAREILNLQGIPHADLRSILNDEISRRRQIGPRVSVSMKSILKLAEQTISVAEICARTGWNQRRAKWRLAPFRGCRTAVGWDRAVIESSDLPL
ncbi:hypothetical protein ACFSC3_08985 [Sphingomonas floccifaciens]|uniref:TniQ protein n=1 Tax=Sphingomonas floccifaciens TaxID=1844115 RepID=A0ABW4NCE5_9SPHN